MLNLKNSLLVGASVSAFAMMAMPAVAQDSGAETVIVTGTRIQGMTAADSSAPITVLGNDALTRGAGSADLRQAIGQTVPSFTAESFGSDLGNLTLSAALRGLSPNDTLVLVNGKRRHATGNLNVVSGGGFGGAAAPDISLIPTAAIDHVEVLMDGAAAQYGTDAIAGVVNIILKKKSSGGQLQASSGRYYSTEGDSYDVSYNMGLPLFDKGFVNVTVDKKYSDFTQNGGADNRLLTLTGQPTPEGTIGAPNAAGIVPCSGGVCVPLATRQAMSGYPRTNRINGNAEQNLTTATYNAGYDISDNIQLYSFGSIGHRVAKAYENDRLPNQVIAAPGSNAPCSATNLQGYNTALSSIGTPACAIGLSAGNYSGLKGANAALNGTPIVGSTLINAPGPNNNYRAGLPLGLNNNGQIISSGQVGTLYTPGELVMYPEGFSPQESIKEDDYQYNTGVKFNVAGWDVDTNIGYGKDIDNIYTLNSGNRALFIDTHTSPANFYDGTFTASEFTGTIDATHGFNVGLASPLTVAVGAEAREDMYRIDAGDPASRYKEGGQSYPGFQTTDASSHSRKNYAGYIDLAVAPIEELQIDVAGRFEHYTDFGDAKIGKITARYDFSPKLAVRGTISTGFRAPTLQEEFYSATNVSPTVATVQLPADSSSAKVLGLPDLKPEISTQYSVGFVAHPLDDLTVTVDGYSIALGDRIVRSGTVSGIGGAITTPLALSAIAQHGNVLDPTVTQVGVSSFLNGMSTLTQGVDLTVSYLTDFDDYGLVDWTLAGNYDQTSISSVTPVPAVLAASAPGVTFFQPYTLYNFVHNAPQEKIGLTANWSLDAFGVTFRETYYGPTHGFTSYDNGGHLFPSNQSGVGITDLEARYNITEQVQLAIGGNNLFNIRPNTGLSVGTTSTGGVQVAGTGNVINSPNSSAFDQNGGYYYGRLTFNF